MSELVLDVERLIWRGRALGRLDSGQVVLIEPGVFPGERVRARVTKRARDHLRAEWTDILSPSPHRRPHPCRVSHRCGGCRFGALVHRVELEYKRELLLSEMRRALGRKWADSAPRDIAVHPSPSAWRYRWRGQIEVERQQPHLKALGSGELVHCSDCLLFSRPLSRGANELSRDLSPGRWTVAASPLDWDAGARGSDKWLRLPLPEEGVELRVRPTTFFQANWSMNQKLVRYVRCRAQGSGRVADLYAGAGNFALPCAASGERVLALESDPEAVRGARMAAREQGLEGVRIQKADLGRKDPAELIRGFYPRTLILDPPRAGGGKRLQGLRSLPGLERLVWVSCDAVNTCRDLVPFLEAGWRLREAALFDMFPQTWHMEVVFTLEPE